MGMQVRCIKSDGVLSIFRDGEQSLTIKASDILKMRRTEKDWESIKRKWKCERRLPARVSL